MNLQDLMTKLRSIEEGAEVAPVHTDDSADSEGIIIGSPMGGMMGQPEQPKQQDSVTMNVSMNGSGSGGIKDLMSILRNIENGQSAHHDAEHDHAEPLLGDDDFEEAMGDNGQTFGNSAHGDAGTHVHGVDAVTAKGNDMHSKGGSNPHYSPGNNTLRQSTTVHEGLVEKLHNLYNEVKTRDLTESVLTDDTGHTMQHILTTYKRDVRDFEESGEMNENLYDVLYDYYFDDMPYGVKKARDGDPYEWISNRFASDLGIDETMPVDPMQGVAEGAKWRDAKHKDKLYTQEPRDYDQYDYHDTDYYNGPKPDDYPGEKNLKGGGEFDHSDPLRKGYGRGGTGSTNTHGKRKGLPSRDHVSSLKGSIKSAHGTHPRPNLPE